MLDGYESHFSDRQFASAFEEVGLTRLDWELLVEFYDYDSLAAGTLNPGEERRLSGSMSVSSATTAEDLALLVEDMGRVGAYFIGIAYTGYNAEGAQLFTATDYVTIRTPTQLELTVDSDTEIYYDGREHTVALDGLEEGDILEVRHQQVDAQGQPVGGEQAQFFYISGFDPDTLAPLGYVCDADGYYRLRYCAGVRPAGLPRRSRQRQHLPDLLHRPARRQRACRPRHVRARRQCLRGC